MTKLRAFVDALMAAGVVHSNSGTAIHVSGNGTTTASAGALDKIIRERFQVMRTQREQANARLAEQARE
jgi:hypothetical protein